VIKAVVEALLDDVEVTPIHPEVPLAAYPEYEAAVGQGYLGTGWRGVRAWCQEYGQELELLLTADIVRPYDALIIHVDAAMADKVDREQPCPPARATTDGLRALIVQDWLGQEVVPAFLLLATPSKMTDAWAVAAVAPTQPNIECDPAIRNVLVARHLLPRRSGGIRKRYTVLARRIGTNLAQVRRLCTEADRFTSHVEARHRTGRLRTETE
jgi:hypothetical protein